MLIINVGSTANSPRTEVSLSSVKVNGHGPSTLLRKKIGCTLLQQVFSKSGLLFLFLVILMKFLFLLSGLVLLDKGCKSNETRCSLISSFWFDISFLYIHLLLHLGALLKMANLILYIHMHTYIVILHIYLLFYLITYNILIDNMNLKEISCY